MITLTPKPLTREAFAPYGDVVEAEGARHWPINQGFAERFHDLARIDVSKDGGEPCISIFEARPRAQPIALTLMERHPLGTQLFYPLQNAAWLAVVCRDPADPASFEAFAASGAQGVNYARNTWHHPLLVFAPSRFLIVDRKGEGSNLEEVQLSAHIAVMQTGIIS